MQPAFVAAMDRVEPPIDEGRPGALPNGEPPSLGRNRRDVIIGDSVNATMAETVTAPTRVKANSVNNAPVRPPWKPIGT